MVALYVLPVSGTTLSGVGASLWMMGIRGAAVTPPAATTSPNISINSQPGLLIPWRSFRWYNDSSSEYQTHNEPSLPGTRTGTGLLTRSIDKDYLLFGFDEAPPGAPAGNGTATRSHSRAMGAYFYDDSLWWHIYASRECVATTPYPCLSDYPTLYGALGDAEYNTNFCMTEVTEDSYLLVLNAGSYSQGAVARDCRGITSQEARVIVSTSGAGDDVAGDNIVSYSTIPTNRAQLIESTPSIIGHAFDEAMVYGGIAAGTDALRDKKAEIWVASGKYGVLRFSYNSTLSTLAAILPSYQLWVPGCPTAGFTGVGQGRSAAALVDASASCGAAGPRFNDATIARVGVLAVALSDPLFYRDAVGTAHNNVALYLTTRYGVYAIDLPSTAGDAAAVWRAGGAPLVAPPAGGEFRGLAPAPYMASTSVTASPSPSPSLLASPTSSISMSFSPTKTPLASKFSPSSTLTRSPTPTRTPLPSPTRSPHVVHTAINTSVTILIATGPLPLAVWLSSRPALLLRAAFAGVAGVDVGAITLVSARKLTLSVQNSGSSVEAASRLRHRQLAASVAFCSVLNSGAGSVTRSTTTTSGDDMNVILSPESSLIKSALNGVPAVGALAAARLGISGAATLAVTEGTDPGPLFSSSTGAVVRLAITGPPSDSHALVSFYIAAGVVDPGGSNPAEPYTGGSVLIGGGGGGYVGVSRVEYEAALNAWAAATAATWVAPSDGAAAAMRNVLMGASQDVASGIAAVRTALNERGAWWAACAAREDEPSLAVVGAGGAGQSVGTAAATTSALAGPAVVGVVVAALVILSGLAALYVCRRRVSRGGRLGLPSFSTPSLSSVSTSTNEVEENPTENPYPPENLRGARGERPPCDPVAGSDAPVAMKADVWPVSQLFALSFLPTRHAPGVGVGARGTTLPTAVSRSTNLWSTTAASSITTAAMLTMPSPLTTTISSEPSALPVPSAYAHAPAAASATAPASPAPIIVSANSFVAGAVPPAAGRLGPVAALAFARAGEGLQHVLSARRGGGGGGAAGRRRRLNGERDGDGDGGNEHDHVPGHKINAEHLTSSSQSFSPLTSRRVVVNNFTSYNSAVGGIFETASLAAHGADFLLPAPHLSGEPGDEDSEPLSPSL